MLLRKVTRERLKAALQPLLKASFSGVEALKPIQEGTNWYHGMQALSDPPEEEEADALGAIERCVAEVGLEAERAGDALVCQHRGHEVRFSCSGGDLRAASLAVASSSPRSSIKLKLGEPVPECEALVAELDRRHAETPCTLSWDPKTGVFSSLAVRAAACGGADIELLLETVTRPGPLEQLEALASDIRA